MIRSMSKPMLPLCSHGKNQCNILLSN